ncbi:hypothetical protein GGF31_004553 [Allomyces arbusculus]|nr:hypothetical protein GGF31_004553 [Allomyces arbusculus]
MERYVLERLPWIYRPPPSPTPLAARPPTAPASAPASERNARSPSATPFYKTVNGSSSPGDGDVLMGEVEPFEDVGFGLEDVPAPTPATSTPAPVPASAPAAARRPMSLAERLGFAPVDEEESSSDDDD